MPFPGSIAARLPLIPDHTVMATVLLEIGTEEMPASYIPPALAQLAELGQAQLSAERIAVEQVQTWGTPRRLALYLSGVAPQQGTSVREVRGPAVEAAFAVNGMPTQAAIGFARSQGIPTSELRIKQMEGGEFVVAVFHDEGRPTPELLPDIFTRLITALTFPQTMRWGAGSLRFARPIRWIVALLDDQVIPLALDGVESDRLTRGHRFLAPGEVAVPDAESYRRVMEENHVLVVPEERREAVRRQLEAIAQQDGAAIVDDGVLLETTVYHLEFPTAVRCRIDEQFLTLPREILEHVLSAEQQFFPLKDRDGALLPAFIAVRNGDKAYLGGVRSGYEAVARAKLLDALYFFDQDLRRTLFDRVEDLRGIIFQERLGTMHDKAVRLQALAGAISERLGATSQQRMLAERAALLCKADLVTALVNEHPMLRGTLGGVFARHAGEPDAVAAAITEHYHPESETDALPATTIGRIVALADRLDTVVGCFAVGLVPVDGTDPFILRRNAVGVVHILAGANLRLPLGGLADDALATLPEPLAAPREEIRAALEPFFRLALERALQVEGIPPAVQKATITVSADVPADALHRARVITRQLGDPAFGAIVRAATRLAHLARNAPEIELRADALTEPAERELLTHYQGLAPRAEFFASRGEFDELPALLAELTPAVNRFFAEVKVMADVPDLRDSRLALVHRLSRLFRLLGDLSAV
jgi:glycyl-tRNA synthetase beta chain